MKLIKQFFFILIYILILTSCAKFEVKEVNKDLRIISYTYEDGVIKFINQKFNSKQNTWLEAKCLNNKIKYYFLDCKKDNIIYTKTSLAIIKNLETNKNNNNQILLVAKTSEESSSQEEDNFEESFDLAPLPGGCVGGSDVC